MNQGNDTILAPPPSVSRGSTKPTALKELPHSSVAPDKEAILEKLPEHLLQDAEKTAKWRLAIWFEDWTLWAWQVPSGIAVGTALAFHRGVGFSWYAPVLMLVGILSLLSGGRLDRARLRLAVGLFGVATVCFGLLVLTGGYPVVVLGLVAAVLAALGTGIVPCAFRSQADTAVRLGVTVALVGGVCLAMGNALNADVFVAGLQLGILATSLGAVNSLRDMARDRQSGRKTLTVRFGVPAGRYQVALLCLIPYTMNLCWAFSSAWGAALLPLLSLPLAAWIIRGVNLYAPGPMFNAIRPWAVSLYLAFTVLLTAGFLL